MQRPLQPTFSPQESVREVVKTAPEQSGELRKHEGEDTRNAGTSHGLSLSALRDGGAGPKREDRRGADATTEHPDQADVSLESAPAKKIARPTIDLEGLRRAINESLKKQSGGTGVVSAHATNERRPSSEEANAEQSQSGAGSGASIVGGPTRSVRLNVPSHEDVDAKEQITRELSKMDAEDASLGMGAKRREGDAPEIHEEHDTRLVKDAREKINQSLSRQNVRNSEGPRAAVVTGNGPGVSSRVSEKNHPKQSPDIITSG
jgi:hypothetical protein